MTVPDMYRTIQSKSIFPMDTAGLNCECLAFVDGHIIVIVYFESSTQ